MTLVRNAPRSSAFALFVLVVVALFLPVTAAMAAPPQPEAASAAFVDARRTVAVDPRRGVDPRVDYPALVRFGPWDDRNYKLKAEDVALLAPGEDALDDPLPAFFRVGFRRAVPDLPRTGPVQYPRSAREVFRGRFGGYLVNGLLYRRAKRAGKTFHVVLENGVPFEEFGRSRDDQGEALSGEVRVTNPNGASESAVKIHPTDPDKVIAGVNAPFYGQDMYWSTNGGSTWTRTTLPNPDTCCDPTVDWSSDGQYAYTGTLGNCGFSCSLLFYRSTDGGKTWKDQRVISTNADKEYIHVDKSATSPFRDRIYVTWQANNVMQFAYSANLGLNWTTQNLGGGSEDRGIGSDIATDRAGNVYYAWPGFNSRTIRVRKSTNGGVTFGAPVVAANTDASYDFPIPSMEDRRAFVYTAVDVDLTTGPYSNAIYIAFTDSVGPDTSNPSANHARVRVAYSRNGGATWNVTTAHETADELTVDRWHPWLAVGPDGVVHVVYYDTRRSPDRTAVDLFYTYSTDGAGTFAPPQRVTALLSPNIFDGFEFGDYNGLDIVLTRLIAIFTDNRSESGTPGDSVDIYAAGITPGGGAICGNGAIEPGETCDGINTGGATCQSLGCTGGVLGCRLDCDALDVSGCLGCPGTVAGQVPASLAVARQGADLLLSWGAACAPAQDYEVYEGALFAPATLVPRLCSTGGATSALLTPGAGGCYYLVVAANRGVEGSYGRTSAGTERAPSASACLPQAVGSCP